MSDIDETLPDVVKSFLRAGHVLERIVLHENGKWTHEGLDFENEKIIDLFFRSVGRTAGGTWVLEIPPYTYPIEVERTGYFVTALDAGTGEILLSDGQVETLRPETLHYQAEGRMFCRVKEGKFEARFLRGAYYQLAAHIDDSGSGGFELSWLGKRHPILIQEADRL